MSANKNDTAIFINKVLTWWKILNVKTLQIDKLNNDSLQYKIRTPNYSPLNFIKFRQIALNMAESQGNCIKELPKHTTTTIHPICNGIVNLYQ